MNFAFLLIADGVLLARLPLFLSADPSRRSSWVWKSAVELLLLLCLGWNWNLLWAALTILGTNAATLATLGRFKRKEAAYLLFGALDLVLLSLWLSPASGVRVRPLFADLGSWLCDHSALGWPLVQLVSVRSLTLLAGLLLAGNEANLLIRLILEFLRLKPAKQAAGEVEYNRGRMIGLFERALIYAFIISTQYQSIGLILAAKTFARFKKLEDQDFAEYVLIGTLLSAAIAMAIAVLIRRVL